MTRIAVMMLGTLGSAPAAWAFCMPGEVDDCYLDGKNGTRTCGADGMYGVCEVPEDPSTEVELTYKILAVIYAPPGTAAGSPSSATYGSGSTFGTTSSCSESVTAGITTTASVGEGVLAGTGASFNLTTNTTRSDAVDIRKTTSTQIQVFGPGVDGIDHDRDQIWLWLNPEVHLSFPDTNTVDWALGVDDDEIVDLTYVYVGDLKNPAQMPVAVADRLAAAGITEDDYAEILLADPFAWGPVPIDPDRYVQLPMTFPYQPPYEDGDTSPALTFSASYADTDTASQSNKVDYTVGITQESGLPLAGKLKVEGKVTWSDVESTSTSTGTTETASLTVRGPSHDYEGPVDMAVYFDTIYRTFLFEPIDPRVVPLVEGVVTTGTGVVARPPAPGTEIVLVDDRRVEHRTFTDANGGYRLYSTDGRTPGTATLHLGAAAVPLTRADFGRSLDLQLP